jgi:hypothetical protein
MRDPELVRFFEDEHAIDEQNASCECGWYYGSPESYGEHLADAIEARYMLIPKERP